MSLVQHNTWWESIWQDVELLSGESLTCVFTALAETIKAQYVVIIGEDWLIECFKSHELMTRCRVVVSIDDLLKMLPQIIQVDWGDFYFCHTLEGCANIRLGVPISSNIAKSLFTARAVDGGWLYLYKRDKQIIEILKTKRLEVTAQENILENFHYPY